MLQKKPQNSVKDSTDTEGVVKSPKKVDRPGRAVKRVHKQYASCDELKSEIPGLKYNNLTRSEALAHVTKLIDNRDYDPKAATLFFQLAKKDDDFRFCIHQYSAQQYVNPLCSNEFFKRRDRRGNRYIDFRTIHHGCRSDFSHIGDVQKI